VNSCCLTVNLSETDDSLYMKWIAVPIGSRELSTLLKLGNSLGDVSLYNAIQIYI